MPFGWGGPGCRNTRIIPVKKPEGCYSIENSQPLTNRPAKPYYLED